MAMTTDLIVQALNNNAANNVPQAQASVNIAAAIIATIEQATLTYTVGLVDSTGSPVTGVLTSVTLS